MTRPQPLAGPQEVLIYTGGNGDDMAAACEEMTVVSDSGTALVWEDGGSVQRTCQIGDGVLLSNGVAIQKLAEEEMVHYAMPVARRSDFALAMGAAAVPAIILNGNDVVPVTISPAMPDGDYTATAVLTGTIGSLSITEVTVVDIDTVDVTCQAGLAYVAGARVVVTAIRH